MGLSQGPPLVLRKSFNRPEVVSIRVLCKPTDKNETFCTFEFIFKYFDIISNI